MGARPEGARSARPDNVCYYTSEIYVNVHSQGTRPRRGGSRTQFAKRPDQPACACLGPQKKGGGATTVALVGFALWAKGRTRASGMDAEQEVQVLWRP